MPHARTRTSTSSSPISGRGMSTTSSFLYSDNRRAFIVFLPPTTNQLLGQSLYLIVHRVHRERAKEQGRPDERGGAERAYADGRRQHLLVQGDQHERVEEHHHATRRRRNHQQREWLRHVGKQDAAPKPDHSPYEPEIHPALAHRGLR